MMLHMFVLFGKQRYGAHQFFETHTPHIMGILATPPKATPPRNKALLRDY